LTHREARLPLQPNDPAIEIVSNALLGLRKANAAAKRASPAGPAG
jgi:hypothetical protein